MLSVQMTGWPVVTVCFRGAASDQDVERWLHDLSDLLHRRQWFSIVVQANPSSQFSPAARKSFGIWFKQHKPALQQFCRGVARVVSSKEQGGRVVSDNMKKAMPFPMVAVYSDAEGLKWADERLID